MMSVLQNCIEVPKANKIVIITFGFIDSHLLHVSEVLKSAGLVSQTNKLLSKWLI